MIKYVTLTIATVFAGALLGYGAGASNAHLGPRPVAADAPAVVVTQKAPLPQLRQVSLARPSQPIQIQMPCMMPPLASMPACVLVDRQLDGTTEFTHEQIDTATAELLRNKVDRFAIIYSYEVSPEEVGTTAVKISMNNGQTVVREIDNEMLGLFWVTTNDAGQTWSPIQSNYKLR